MDQSLSKRLSSSDDFDCFENSLLVANFSPEPPSKLRRSIEKYKLAIFDLDETLITTRSKKVFSHSINDWKFVFENVLEKLSKFSKKGFLIFVVTNQLGISKGFFTSDTFVKKLSEVFSNCSFKVVVLVATKDDKFRKPRIGAFDYILQHYLNIKYESIDHSVSFYCGDSAGRIGSNGYNDHSSVDLLFSLNIGLKFCIPEEIFKKKKPFFSPLLNEKVKKITPNEFMKCYVDKYIVEKRLLVFIAGPPRSGKTFLASFFENFEIFRINKANYRSKFDKLRALLTRSGYKIVIDLSVQAREVSSILETIIEKSSATKVVFKVNYDFEFTQDLNHHSYFDQHRGHNTFSNLKKEYSSYQSPLSAELFDFEVDFKDFVPQFGRHTVQL